MCTCFLRLCPLHVIFVPVSFASVLVRMPFARVLVSLFLIRCSLHMFLNARMCERQMHVCTRGHFLFCFCIVIFDLSIFSDCSLQNLTRVVCARSQSNFDEAKYTSEGKT